MALERLPTYIATNYQIFFDIATNLELVAAATQYAQHIIQKFRQEAGSKRLIFGVYSVQAHIWPLERLPLLILPRTIKYSSILPQLVELRGGGHAIRSAYNIELSARSGSKRLIFGCIVYRPIYMASRKTPSLILPRTIKYSSILPQTEVELRGGGHAIRSAYNIELSARSGSKRLIFGVYSVQAYIYGSRKTPYLYCHELSNILRYCHKLVESRGAGHAIRSAYNIELSARSGSKRLILGCIVYRPIYMASRKTPSTYIATNYQIFFDIATNWQNCVAVATQYAQHIIQNFRQEAGSKLTDFGVYSVQAYIYGLQKDSLYLYCHELSNILRYCHKLVESRGGGHAIRSAYNIELSARSGVETTDFFGCIVYRPIYMASRKTPSTYIATNYQIFFDIATNWQNRVAPATQYAQHIIQNFRQEAGSKRLIFGVYSVQAYIYGLQKDSSTYIATNYQIFFDIATTGRIAWRRPRNTLSI